jgi:hypothetical protein
VCYSILSLEMIRDDILTEYQVAAVDRIPNHGFDNCSYIYSRPNPYISLPGVKGVPPAQYGLDILDVYYNGDAGRGCIWYSYEP